MIALIVDGPPYGHLFSCIFLFTQLKQLNADVHTSATLPMRPTPTVPVCRSAAVDPNPVDVTLHQNHHDRSTPIADHLASCRNGNSVRTPPETMIPLLDGGGGSSGSLKRPGHQKVSNTNVMGKIRDRTGVPV